MAEDIEAWWKNEVVQIVKDDYQILKDGIGFGYGVEFIQITQDDIQALLNGSVLGWSDGEYSHFIRLSK